MYYKFRRENWGNKYSVKHRVNFSPRKGPFPLVRFNRVDPRGCHIIQPSLNPCIISIHAEPARVICLAGRKSNNV